MNWTIEPVNATPPTISACTSDKWVPAIIFVACETSAIGIKARERVKNKNATKKTIAP